MALSSRVAKHRQTAERKRIDARGHLEFVREVCKQRLQRDRLVLLENPWGSDAWEETVLEEILLDPSLDFVRTDQCQWGLADKESGQLYQKATGFVVAIGPMARRLLQRCNGAHTHEQIAGSNAVGRRSTRAGAWMKDMCVDIIEGALDEFLAREDFHEAFPAEHAAEQDRPRKRLRGKTAYLPAGDNAVIYNWRGGQWLAIKHRVVRSEVYFPEGEDIDFDMRRLVGELVTRGPPWIAHLLFWRTTFGTSTAGSPVLLALGLG
jgi:hypothetical protein